jgi:hypothetical protein
LSLTMQLKRQFGGIRHCHNKINYVTESNIINFQRNLLEHNSTQVLLLLLQYEIHYIQKVQTMTMQCPIFTDEMVSYCNILAT